MSVRSVLPASLALVAILSACGPAADDLSAYLDRNPALRTMEFGYQYTLDAPAGYARLRSSSADMETVRTHAFVGYRETGASCEVVAVHHVTDAEAGVRAPGQVFDTCGSDPFNTAGFAQHIDARGELMTAGTNLFRRSGDEYRFDGDLSLALRGGLEFEDVVVIADDEVALATMDTVFVLRHDGNTWVEADRLPVGDLRSTSTGTPQMHFDGELLGIAKVVYRRLPSGEFVEVGRFDREVIDVRDNRGLVPAGYRQVVHTYTGDWDEPFTAGPPTTDQGHAGQLLDTGVAHTGQGELVIFDAEGRRVTREQVIDSRSGGFMALRVHRDRALAQFDGRVEWLHLLGHDPIEGRVLDVDATVASREEHVERFEIQEGTRSLIVRLSGDGDGDLYVRYGDAPSRRDFDCSPYRHGSDEVCTFTDPTPGTWYAAVHGFDPVSDVTITATVD